MRVRQILAAVALFTIFHPVVAQTQAPAQTEPTPALSEWLIVKTDHFAVISNTDPERAKLIAYKLEQFRYVFSQFVPELVSATPVPTRVRVFRDGSSYTAGLPNISNLNSAVAGYFQPGADLITINDLFNISDSVSFHEYTHLLTRFDSDAYPLWFVEGIAQFYETFEISGRRARIGEISAARLHSLRISPFIPLRKLLGFSNYHQITQESSIDMFYAESWALVHYLMMDNQGQRRTQLIEFLNQLNDGQSLDAAFRAAFQADFKTIENELTRYLESSKFQVFTCEFDSEKIESDVEITSLTEMEKVSRLEELPKEKLNITLRRNDAKRRGAIAPDFTSKLGVKVVASNRPINLSPNDPNLAAKAKEALAKFNDGNQLYEAGRPEAALAKYEEALKLDPEFAPAYMHIGNIYAEAGLYELAHLAYEKARAVAPNYAGTYLNFAVTQYQQGNSTEAETSFRTALSLYPSSAAAHLGLGNIYLQRRQYARARTEYQRAINLTRGTGLEALNAYIGLGAVYFYEGQYEQAKAQYQQAIKLDPDNGTWYRAYGDNCRMLKQYDQATTAYLHALKLNQHDTKAQESLNWLIKFSEYQRTIAQWPHSTR